MDRDTAIEIIRDYTIHRGWTIDAEPYDRFETGVLVKFTYTNPNYSMPPELWDEELFQKEFPSERPIIAGLYETEAELMKAVADEAITCFTHELRESLRRRSKNNWAPLHPHTDEGMRNWGDPQGDLNFGKAVR